MWKLKQLLNANDMQALINGKHVPARPENFKPYLCSVWKRLHYAWQVVLGRAETFVWPEGQ